MVLGPCRLLLRDPIEAEDATQQVFLAAHRSVLGGSPPRDPHAWLAAIARNECRARIQARQGEPVELTELPSDLPDPLAAAIRAIDLQAIWAAISSLPRRQRRALLLREVGGLSYRELGRALGITDSSVESLLFRARRHVRSLVATALPLALRDELARLIPGFDPGSAGLAARAASFPLALKLATAAVTVGVVTTGGSHFPGEHAPPARPVVHPKTSVKAASPLPASRVAPLPAELHVAERSGSYEVEHHSRREAEREQRGRPEPEQAAREDRSRDVQSAPTPEPEPAVVEPTQAETSDTSSGDSTGPGSDGEASSDDG